jgi:hypothetical protein
MSNSNEILIIENFLPSNFHNELLSIVNNENYFPWFYSSNISSISQENSIKQYGFSHILYDEQSNFYSNYFNNFYPIKYFIESKFQVNIKNIIRYRLGLNLNISDKKSIIHHAHKDYEFNHHVLLYYLNNSDGPTIFYSNDEYIEIEPEGNKAVLFDGSIMHSSSTPINHEKRIALNINLILEK